MHFWLQNAPWAPRASLTTRQTRSKLKNRKVHFWDFMLKSIFDGKLIFYHFYFWKWILQFVFVQKASFRHFARNVTIVSPNGGPGGTNHSKCEKTQLSIFLPQSHIFAPKVYFELFLHFWAIFTLLAPNGPKKHQETITPTSFWATGPKNRILSSKIRKILKMHPNTHF